MSFVVVWVIQIVWLLSACAYVHSKEKVDPWLFFVAVLTATIYAIPASLKLSFGG